MNKLHNNHLKGYTAKGDYHVYHKKQPLYASQNRKNLALAGIPCFFV